VQQLHSACKGPSFFILGCDGTTVTAMDAPCAHQATSPTRDFVIPSYEKGPFIVHRTSLGGPSTAHRGWLSIKLLCHEISSYVGKGLSTT
jgi:hypothetical protein